MENSLSFGVQSRLDCCMSIGLIAVEEEIDWVDCLAG
jgi:hypothetical protein